MAPGTRCRQSRSWCGTWGASAGQVPPAVATSAGTPHAPTRLIRGLGKRGRPHSDSGCQLSGRGVIWGRRGEALCSHMHGATSSPPEVKQKRHTDSDTRSSSSVSAPPPPAATAAAAPSPPNSSRQICPRPHASRDHAWHGRRSQSKRPRHRIASRAKAAGAAWLGAPT
jgi:hypothetical protein